MDKKNPYFHSFELIYPKCPTTPDKILDWQLKHIATVWLYGIQYTGLFFLQYPWLGQNGTKPTAGLNKPRKGSFALSLFNPTMG